jgi:hypothetical protein
VRRRWMTALVVSGWMIAAPADADMDTEDYAATAGAASKREQVNIGRQIETARKNEEEQERRDTERMAAMQEAERVRRDAKPYAEKLAERSCTRCHAADYYLGRRHTWLGWTLVTLRMKYLNGADFISETERREIVAYLASSLGAGVDEAVNEYGIAAAVAGVPPIVAWIAVALRGRRRKKSNDPAGLPGREESKYANSD